MTIHAAVRCLAAVSDRVFPDRFFSKLLRKCGLPTVGFYSVMNLPVSFVPPLKQIFVTLALTIALIVALCVTARADDGASAPNDDGMAGIRMKMTEYLNSSIEQGIATVNKMKRLVSADSAADSAAVTASAVLPVTPLVTAPATKLKLDNINSRYVAKQDEVYDRAHNLSWSRCSLGQHWINSKGCAGTVRQVKFDQAAQFANGKWRLPSQAELATLIDPTKKNMLSALSIDTVAFPDMDETKLYYWTSTEHDNSFAWAVLFVDSGIRSILYREHRYAVRMVRTGA